MAARAVLLKDLVIMYLMIGCPYALSSTTRPPYQTNKQTQVWTLPWGVRRSRHQFRSSFMRRSFMPLFAIGSLQGHLTETVDLRRPLRSSIVLGGPGCG